MRIAPALAALALVSCGSGAQESAGQEARQPTQQSNAASPTQGSREDRAIECAIGGAAFARSCTIQSSEGAQGLTVVIRNAEGGFRRLLLPRDGSGAVAADGAEPATVTVLPDGRAEVAIGRDRYRLPATIGPTPRAR